MHYYDNEIYKPDKREYSMKLPVLDEGECWYLHVDFWYGLSWCKIYDQYNVIKE